MRTWRTRVAARAPVFAVAGPRVAARLLAFEQRVYVACETTEFGDLGGHRRPESLSKLEESRADCVNGAGDQSSGARRCAVGKLPGGLSEYLGCVAVGNAVDPGGSHC